MEGHLKTRLITAVVLIPIVLAMVANASSFWIAVLACLTAGIAADELFRLNSTSPRLRFPFPILAAAVLAYFLLFSSSQSWSLTAAPAAPLAQLFALALVGSLLAPFWVKRNARVLFEVSALWCTAPLISLVLLHSLYTPKGTNWSLNPVLLLIIPLWIGDSLAYFVGKRFGKHLLAPRISPKKTIEGAAANLAGCIVGGLGVGALIGVPLWIGLVTGALAGILGQAGDLFESALKRSAGAKDSGSLLPGHGGLLDRIDSLLLSAPAQALFLALVWPPR